MDHNLDFLKADRHHATLDFLENTLDNDLLPCISRPTRITKQSATLINNILISKGLQGRELSYIPITDISDHLPCIVSLNGPFLSKKKGSVITT